MFDCKDCNYSTERKSDMTRHESTARHIRNMKNKKKARDFKCDDCDKSYTLRCNLDRHVKTCIKKQMELALQEKDQQLKDYKMEFIKKENAKLLAIYDNIVKTESVNNYTILNAKI